MTHESPGLRFLAPLLLLGLLAGCLVSTMDKPSGTDLAVHFDSSENRASLYLSSIPLALVGFWFLKMAMSGGSASGAATRVVPGVIGVALLAGATWLFVDGKGKVDHYQIELRKAGLWLSIPPEQPREIPWRKIEESRIEGYGEQIGTVLVEDWETMELTLKGGERVLVDLSELSIEQRRAVWKGIWRKAGLREVPAN